MLNDLETARVSRVGHVNPAAVIDTLLRGVGQVMFQSNPITGLLLLVVIFINSHIYCFTVLLGSVVATLAATRASSSPAF